LIKFNKFNSPEKMRALADQAVDVSRRESLGHLVRYTAPAMLAMLLSSNKAAMATSSNINPP